MKWFFTFCILLIPLTLWDTYLGSCVDSNHWWFVWLAIWSGILTILDLALIFTCLDEQI